MGDMERSQITAVIVSTQPALDEKADPTPAHPLAPIAGKPVVAWVVDAAVAASIRRIGVVAHDVAPADRDELRNRTDNTVLEIVTPRADLTESMLDVLSRLDPDLALSDATDLLLIPAEAPHIDPAELRQLISHHRAEANAATLLATEVGNRTDTVIQRNDAGEITSIHDVAVGGFTALLVRASLLIPAMRRASVDAWEPGVPMREIAGLLEQLGHRVGALAPRRDVESISTLVDRSPIEMELRDQVAQRLIECGVSIPDLRQVTIDATVTIGHGVTILPGSILEGDTVVGDDATIGPNTQLTNAVIGTGAHVPHSVVNGVEVTPHEHVTPFSILGSKFR